MLLTFYNAVICILVMLGSLSRGVNILKFDRGRLEWRKKDFLYFLLGRKKRKKRKASAVVGKPFDNFKTLREKRRLSKKRMQTPNDTIQSSRRYVDSRRSSRRGRFRFPNTNTNRYRVSFQPSALLVFNQAYNSH